MNKLLKKFFFLAKVICVYLVLSTTVFTKESNFFIKGKELFDKKQYEKSKILFERDLIFNPKSELSYLFLAKIFKEKEKEEEQETNLNNVLLLNPSNDEAIYMLIHIKVKQFDYSKAKELINKFNLVCKSFCSKKEEIEKKLKTIIPEDNEKNTN